ncbi:MAG TPA: hypothetical protein VHZ24_06270 [Pirellulales bacterium]|jgi:hypothetical protein|nr:hypothetical protein [Pirellulales bacterium]
MKRSRTALALFLGVFGGLLSTIERAGPVGLAASDIDRATVTAGIRHSLGRCEYLGSLEYCEYAYDADPAAIAKPAILSRGCSSPCDPGIEYEPDCVDYCASPSDQAAIRNQAADAESISYQHPGFDCWEASNECCFAASCPLAYDECHGTVGCEAECEAYCRASASAASVAASHTPGIAFVSPFWRAVPPAMGWINGPQRSLAPAGFAGIRATPTIDVTTIALPGDEPVVSDDRHWTGLLGMQHATAVAANVATGYGAAFQGSITRVASIDLSEAHELAGQSAGSEPSMHWTSQLGLIQTADLAAHLAAAYRQSVQKTSQRLSVVGRNTYRAMQLQLANKRSIRTSQRVRSSKRHSER